MTGSVYYIMYLLCSYVSVCLFINLLCVFVCAGVSAGVLVCIFFIMCVCACVCVLIILITCGPSMPCSWVVL